MPLSVGLLQFLMRQSVSLCVADLWSEQRSPPFSPSPIASPPYALRSEARAFCAERADPTDLAHADAVPR